MRRLILGINLACFLPSLQAPAFAALSETARRGLLPDALQAKIVTSSKKKSLSDIDPYIPPQYLRRLALARAYAMTKAILERATGLPVVGPPWHPVKPRERVPYTATIASDRAFYDQGSSVTLSGRATDSNGFAVPNAAVTVSVISNGFTRQFNAVTDGTGNYRTAFNPSPTEAGVYNVAASHPAVVSPIVQSNFTIVGFSFQFANFTATISQNSGVNFNVALGNFGQNAITGLTYDLVELSGAGVTLTLSGPSRVGTLGAGAQTPLTFTASASANAAGAQFALTVTESHGYRRTLPITINVQPAQAAPSVSPTSLTMGLVTGDVKTQVFTLKNTGFAPWTGVTLTQPTISWVTLQGNTNLGDIPPGGNASFTLAFAPPVSLSNSVFSPSPLIQIQSTNEPAFAIPANITVTTSRTGDAVFSVINADRPCSGSQCAPVAGGTVNLVSLDISGLSFNANSDANGTARFTGIPAGNYAWHASASNFQTQNGTMVLQPGISNLANVFLPHATVTYTWSVVPTTIQDVYTVTLNLTFKTDVPAPAIVINPPVINLNMTGGQTAFAQFSITNQGLVAANNYQLNFSGDSAMTVTLPFTSIPTIAAGQTVTVPVQITLAHASCHSGTISQNYSYTCAAGITEQASAQTVNITAGDCGGGTSTQGATPTGPPVTGFGGTGGGSVSNGGGVFSFTGNTTLIPLATPGNSPAPSCSVGGGGGAPPTHGRNGNGGKCGPNPADGDDNIDGNGPSEPGNSPALNATPIYHTRNPMPSPFGYGWTNMMNSSIVQNPDGSFKRTDGDGTETAYVPLGALNQPVNGSGPQFAQPVAVFETLQANSVGADGTPGFFLDRTKDGTVVRYDLFHSTPIYLPTLLTDRNGNTITYSYDSSDRLTKIVDVHGRTVNFSYNAQGYLASITDSAARVYNYTYDANGNKISDTDANGDVTRYAYDSNHHLTQITYPNGGIHTITYTAAGKVASESDDNGNNAQSFTYSTSSTSVVDALGRTTVYEWIETSGLRKITKIHDAAAGLTSFSYDQNMNLVSQTDPLGRTTKFQYDNNGNVTATTDANGGFTQASYEPNFNQPISFTDSLGNRTQMSYDGKGNLTQARDAQGNQAQMAYDAQGHVTATQDPLGHSLSFTYDTNGALGSVTDPLGRRTVLINDALSRIVQHTDPARNVTHFSYDAQGALTQETNALTGITTYGYNPGRTERLLANVTDAKSHSTSFGYDGIGRLTATTDSLGRSKTISHDANGNPITIIDAKGQIITLAYDNLGRLVTKTLPEGAVQYQYDPTGNLTRATNYNGSVVAITYDNDDRVTEETQTLPSGFSARIDYSYDSNGNRLSMLTPWGAFRYSYDLLNRLISITNPNGKTFSFTYDSLGRRVRLDYPNGIITTLNYDSASQLIQIRHNRSADNFPIASAIYSYDATGNRLSMQDMDGTHNYVYDNLRQLTSATHPLSSAILTKNEVFNYDPVGNRLLDTNIAGYTYDAANQLLSNSSFTFTYDNNGNLVIKKEIVGTQTTYAYDSQNELVQTQLPNGKIVDFAYDELGRRIHNGSSGTGISYIYDGQDVLAMIDVNNSLVALFTHGPDIDDPISIGQGNGVDYFIHTDGLGSVVAHTDSLGNLLERIEYESYGKPVFLDLRTSSSPVLSSHSFTGDPYAFTAREFDHVTGLYFYMARYYDSEIGRFISEDPIGLDGGINLYSYADGNPIRFRDPSGTQLEAAFPAIGLTVLACLAFAPCRNALIEIKRNTEIGLSCYKPHKKNQTPSNWDKHSGRRSDAPGSEKGDKRRRPRGPRPPNWKGPWPPRETSN